MFYVPQIDEVAVVIVDNQYKKCVIIIKRQSNTLQRIAETHGRKEALQYLFRFW